MIFKKEKGWFWLALTVIGLTLVAAPQDIIDAYSFGLGKNESSVEDRKAVSLVPNNYKPSYDASRSTSGYVIGGLIEHEERIGMIERIASNLKVLSGQIESGKAMHANDNCSLYSIGSFMTGFSEASNQEIRKVFICSEYLVQKG